MRVVMPFKSHILRSVFKRSLKKRYPLLIAIAVALLILLLAVILSVSGSVPVFTADKELPIYSVEMQEKKAAITFDCAWGAEDIPGILETLKKEDVRATFFIVGQWAEKYPGMVELMASGGHDIANHSYSHLRMGSLDRDRIKSELLKCSSRLEELSGTKTDLFRPPYGDYNNNVVNMARDLGYYTIQWNVDSLDWRPDISQEEIMTRLCRKICPGSIILFHNDTAHTAKMLPNIIKTLKNMGYELVPVSELIMREDYIIDNEGRQKMK